MRKGPLRLRVARALALASTLALSGVSPTQAQRAVATEPLEDAAETGWAAALDGWDLRLGALGVVNPDYEGSEDYQVTGVPYVRLSWKDRIILRSRSLEANLIATDAWRAGPILLTRGGRDEDDNHALDGLGDVDRSFETGAFVRWRSGPWTLRSSVLQDVSGAHEGLVAGVSGSIQLPFAEPWLVLEADTEWASDDFMQTVYGVDSVQSRRSGMRMYRAHSGFKHVGISLASRVPIDARWSALLSLGYKRLLDDAADSPIVDERGDENGYTASCGVVYRF